MSDRRNTPPIAITNIALTNPRAGGKHYRRRRDGTLDKETVGWIAEGRVYVDEVADMADFCTLLNEELTPGENVLTYGVPRVPVPEDGLPLVTKATHDGSPDVLTRTSEQFDWADDPGIFAIDYDPRDGHQVLNRDELWSRILKIAPALAEHDVVWMPSSSSFIFDSHSGEQLVGLKGQRLYFAARDASDIPRAGAVLLKRAWLKGEGCIFISGSGAQLVRALTDPCMYQPERVDYAAGAVCERGLEQRREPAFLINEGLALVDTRMVFPDLTPAEETAYQRLVSDEMKRTLPDARAQREDWADAQIEKQAMQDLGLPVVKDGPESGLAALDDRQQSQVRARSAELVASGRKSELLRLASNDGERPVLPLSHMLKLDRFGWVTVEEILRDPNKYDGATGADPLEPDYGGGRCKSKLFLNGYVLVSQAHGQQRTYRLGTNEDRLRARAARSQALTASYVEMLETFNRKGKK